MKSVSNRKLCGGSTNKNIGFWFKVTFTVYEDDEAYAWKVPTDFGFGGIAMMDGKIIRNFRNDIWSGGKATQLNFISVLTAGQHTLEVFGAEKCCDGAGKWMFQVSGGQWLDFTVGNLENPYRN
jgi:hypothetical protein